MTGTLLGVAVTGGVFTLVGARALMFALLMSTFRFLLLLLLSNRETAAPPPSPTPTIIPTLAVAPPIPTVAEEEAPLVLVVFVCGGDGESMNVAVVPAEEEAPAVVLRPMIVFGFVVWSGAAMDGDVAGST